MTSRIAARCALALTLLEPCATSAAQERATYAERYRPQYHFTPAANWMNDPNGLVFFAGEYHLFYQFNPFGNTWGHMSWGHAVSRDLVHWEHLPIAIPEAAGVMAFSGSVVVDSTNSGGFGRRGEPALVAIYTGYRGDRNSQSQYIAYSTDRGRTWTRYAGNPVLDIGSLDFRDPKVFWYESQRKWVMVVALATEHKVSVYSSPDLKQWTHLSDFGPAGAVGGAWECPDLFQLSVAGDPLKTRWVLIVNLNPGGIGGGSGTQYFVGDFDGSRFAADESGSTSAAASASGSATLWADYGRDFYAASSWSNIPLTDGRRVWIGWMNNWQYGKSIPTSPWRSAQTVPRALTLVTTGGGVRLAQQPVAELEQLRGVRRRVGPRTIPAGSTSLASRGIAGRALEIVADLEAGSATEFGLKVRVGGKEETVIGIDPRAGQIFVDRIRSGPVGFHPEFSGRHAGPLPSEKGRVRLHVLVDWSSIEVFAGDGQTVITDQIFPAGTSAGVALYAKGGAARLISLDAWPLRSIWTATRAAATGGTR